MIIKVGMEKGVAEVIKQIKEMAVPVKDADVAKVATISAQSEEIGKLIADALR